MGVVINMKILIVAHPDDEILWFDSRSFDLIVIAFLGRHDKPEIENKRLKVINMHPEKNKIILFSISESGYWKDKSRHQEHNKVKMQLMNLLETLFNKYVPSEVYTHNHLGEYGHFDHILIHNCVVQVLQNHCQIWFPFKFTQKLCKYIPHQVEKIYIPMNIEHFYQIREIYIQHEAWTWNFNYQPSPTECFYRLI